MYPFLFSRERQNAQLVIVKQERKELITTLEPIELAGTYDESSRFRDDNSKGVTYFSLSNIENANTK